MAVHGKVAVVAVSTGNPVSPAYGPFVTVSSISKGCAGPVAVGKLKVMVSPISH
jgi:hypothetical protein